jgi:hypothetical protein
VPSVEATNLEFLDPGRQRRSDSEFYGLSFAKKAKNGHVSKQGLSRGSKKVTSMCPEPRAANVVEARSSGMGTSKVVA